MHPCSLVKLDTIRLRDLMPVPILEVEQIKPTAWFHWMRTLSLKEKTALLIMLLHVKPELRRSKIHLEFVIQPIPMGEGPWTDHGRNVLLDKFGDEWEQTHPYLIFEMEVLDWDNIEQARFSKLEPTIALKHNFFGHTFESQARDARNIFKRYFGKRFSWNGDSSDCFKVCLWSLEPQTYAVLGWHGRENDDLKHPSTIPILKDYTMSEREHWMRQFDQEETELYCKLHDLKNGALREVPVTTPTILVPILVAHTSSSDPQGHGWRVMREWYDSNFLNHNNWMYHEDVILDYDNYSRSRFRTLRPHVTVYYHVVTPEAQMMVKRIFEKTFGREGLVWSKDYLCIKVPCRSSARLFKRP